MELILLIALFLCNIILNAVGDGLNDSDRKTLGHALRALSVAALLSVPLFTRISVTDVLGFIMLRFALFDPSYNITGKLPINYAGTSSLYDRIMGKLSIDIFTRIVFLAAGISVMIRY